jgi:prolyl 4-hydroxylase
LYLEVPEQGGHTSFPKAFGGRGMNVRPPKGSAALFYSMLPDGNADDLSLHAGNPVIDGKKWICNLVSYVCVCVACFGMLLG